MKMGKLFLALLISSVSPVVSGGRYSPRQNRGQPLPLPQTNIQSNTVELSLSYDFSVTGKTNRISFIVVLPENVPDRQSIVGTRFSPKPSKIFNRNGNRYAEFVFFKPDKRTRIEIIIKAQLFRYDLLTAIEQRPESIPEGQGFADFLKQEKYIEKDHEQIQEIAAGIKTRTDIETVLKVYDYVVDNMEYSAPGKKGRGAVEALRRRRGDCTEYADLFVALCRAKNIPARVVTGYTLGLNTTSSKHNWAEVYLQQYGWVPFDPSIGDIEKAAVRRRLLNMRPAYVYLSHIRNDEVLGDYSFGAYAYSGDRPGFRDSVKFRILAPPMPRIRSNPAPR